MTLSNATDSPVIKTNKALIIGSIGVVFGDIGTSPLYTLKKCLLDGTIDINQASVLGACSLIFWVLAFVVCLKYAFLILRADNNGDGGILALSTLLSHTKLKTKYIALIGLIGTAFFYGDGVITPAISVISAIEGINLLGGAQKTDVIVFISALILVVLFISQKYGTAKIGRFFGPIMVVWFCTIGCLGLIHIFNVPVILKALNPFYSIQYLTHHPKESLTILGYVVLAITGAEALYADLGHFNRSSIRSAWFYFVFPCLLLNYFGQGALLLSNPHTIENPFYHMCPSSFLTPMIILATLATIIASQSIISGIFSMTWQAIQMGFLPRMQVIHTSEHHYGQIYIPFINYILLFLTLLATISFRTSDALAAAYGFSVISIMLITSYLLLFVTRYVWHWSMLKTFALGLFLMTVDGAFFVSNSLKLFHGAWFPILIAAGCLYVFQTWQKGQQSLLRQARQTFVPLKTFLKQTKSKKTTKVPGTAVYLTRTLSNTPAALVMNHEHNHVLHENVFILTMSTEPVPKVTAEKLSVESRYKGVSVIQIRYGYAEIPNIHLMMSKLHKDGIIQDISDVSYFLSRGVPILQPKGRLGIRGRLFLGLVHNAASPADFFKIPSNLVFEIGIRYKVSLT